MSVTGLFQMAPVVLDCSAAGQRRHGDTSKCEEYFYNKYDSKHVTCTRGWVIRTWSQKDVLSNKNKTAK